MCRSPRRTLRAKLPALMELALARAQPPVPRASCLQPLPTRTASALLPWGLSSLPRALACALWLWHVHHTPPKRASWVPAPLPWARGSQVLPTATGHIHMSPASVPHDMLHIYTFPGGEADPGAWCENEGWKDTSQLSPGSWHCWESSTSCPLGKDSCSWKSVHCSSVWGKRRGAAPQRPERGHGWPP